MRATLQALLPCLGLVACGGASDPMQTPDAGTRSGDLAYSPCANEARIGTFSVRLQDGFSSADGRVFDGVVPANVRAVTAEMGACQLLEGRNLFCDPACGAGETCGEDGVCIEYPRARSVGAVTLSGLKVALEMTPSSVGYYSNGSTNLPHPAFDEGAGLRLSAPGDELAGFELAGAGIAPLAGVPAELALERGAGLTVTWTPGAEPAARVRLVLDLAHHGGVAASLECDGLDDSGQFDVPTTLVDALMDIGVAGYPTITVSRRTGDHADLTEGCVEFTIVSETVSDLIVPGVTSCTFDEDCGDQEICREDLTCG